MNQDQVVGEILRHAADKEAYVADMQAELIREVQNENMRRVEELASELRRQFVKRDYRVGAAKQVAEAGVTVRVFNQEGELVAEGVLKSVNAKTGKVNIQAGPTKRKLVELTYATPMPVPTHLKEAGQTYYGMDEVLNFNIVSIPDGREWMVR